MHVSDEYSPKHEVFFPNEEKKSAVSPHISITICIRRFVIMSCTRLFKETICATEVKNYKMLSLDAL